MSRRSLLDSLDAQPLVRTLRRIPEAWITPLMLLAVCFLSYGLFIPRLGFYYDDWLSVWVAHAIGPRGIEISWALDRPFLGWIHVGLTSLFGLSPLPWHIFILGMHWLTALAVRWIILGLWPNRARLAATIALLFAVYPGFQQGPVSIVYGPGVFVPLAICLFSLAAMVWSFRLPRYFWLLLILSYVGAFLHGFLIEYFMGVELFRLGLLWVSLSTTIQGLRQRWYRWLVLGIPYVVILVGNMVWRIAFIDPVAVSNRQLGGFLGQLLISPISELSRRLSYAITDFADANFIAWAQTLPTTLFDLPGRVGFLAIALILGSGTLVAVYFWFTTFEPPTPANSDSKNDLALKETYWVAGLGFIGGMVSMFPIWLSDRQILWSEALDRYTLVPLLAVSMMWGATLVAVIRNRWQHAVIVGLLVGLAVSFHFRNAYNFKTDREQAESLFWQLSWRVPALKPGTSIFIYQDPPSLPQPKDYALGVPLNLVYDYDHKSLDLNYWMFPSAPPYPTTQWFSLLRSADPQDSVSVSSGLIVRQVRGLSFSGSAQDTLVIYYRPPSCLRILDPATETLAQLPLLAQAAQPRSNIDTILTDTSAPKIPPVEFFGPQPAADWCWYFERADLARQRKDWPGVAQLADQVQTQGFQPTDRTEWLPFVEGYIQVGRDADARKLLHLVRYDDFRDRALTDPTFFNPVVPDEIAGPSAVCGLLQRLGTDTSINLAAQATVQKMMTEFTCDTP